jgi:predicted double-glycine peptidase
MKRFLPILFFMALTMANAENKNTQVPVYISTGFGTIKIMQKVKPHVEIKHRNIVKQRYDFSCGSATVSTLFNYYLNDPIDEKEAIKGLFEYGNKRNIIKNRGFSMLDIKKFANARGYKVLGYRTDLEGLVALGKPAIVTIVLGNYKHYVIFRGVKKGRVFLADPALGNTILSVKEFEKIWYKNIALVIEPKGKVENRLKISKEDEVMVDGEKLRTILFNQQIYNFTNPNEF